MPAPHTDIAAAGWVARLPAACRPYALLGRFDRPIGAWLLFLPGLWSIALAARPDAQSALLVVLFFLGSFVMRAAGCVVNDMWDRDLDRQVTRTAGRPLACGALRMRHAAAMLAVLLAIGLAILLQLDAAAELLGVASLLLVALYPLAKRVTWWPQAILGLTFGWGAPMGWAARTGTLGWPVLALYAAAIAWIIGYDTIYAHQDREDDALIGVRSTARLFGRRSRLIVGLFYAAAWLLFGLAGWLQGLSALFYVALAPFGAALLLQAYLLDIDDPSLCLKLFKFNRTAGLLGGFAILIGWL